MLTIEEWRCDVQQEIAAGPITKVFSGLGGIFGGGQTPAPVAPPPPPPAPAPMPSADDAAIAEAKKRAVAAEQQRSGRASTILDTGGSNDKLGA